jgi:tryptophanyl-tRNA synthetase
MGWGQFKPLLAETAVAALEPIQSQFNELMAERALTWSNCSLAG